MKKLLLLFIVLSVIGCNKERDELEPDKIYILDYSPNLDADNYFIGISDGEEVSIFNSQQNNNTIVSHPTESSYFFTNNLYLFNCQGNSVTASFSKSFSNSLIGKEDIESIYNIGSLINGISKTFTPGFTISYRDSPMG